MMSDSMFLHIILVFLRLFLYPCKAVNQWVCTGFMSLPTFHWFRSYADHKSMHLNYKAFGPNSIKDR